jgi:hypothetical protein
MDSTGCVQYESACLAWSEARSWTTCRCWNAASSSWWSSGLAFLLPSPALRPAGGEYLIDCVHVSLSPLSD